MQKNKINPSKRDIWIGRSVAAFYLTGACGYIIAVDPYVSQIVDMSIENQTDAEKVKVLMLLVRCAVFTCLASMYVSPKAAQYFATKRAKKLYGVQLTLKH